MTDYRRNELLDLTAAAVSDPGSAAGKRRGPSWPARDAAHSSTEETTGQWAARAVMATLDDAGALLPTSGRLATFRPGGAGRTSTAIIQLEGAHDIFRFTINMLGQQIEFGSAGRAILVDLRDHMGAERFDMMALSLLGADRYEKMHDRFLRDFDCLSCETTIRVGWRYCPDRSGAVCARCCQGFPEYEAKLTKRLPEPVPTAPEKDAA